MQAARPLHSFSKDVVVVSPWSHPAQLIEAQLASAGQGYPSRPCRHLSPHRLVGQSSDRPQSVDAEVFFVDNLGAGSAHIDQLRFVSAV